MNIFLVRPEQVVSCWPSIRDYLIEAMAYGWDGLYAEWDVKRACLDGQWGLWIARANDENIAALVTRFHDYPQARVCESLLCGGRDLDAWLPGMMATIEAHAMSRGARFLQGFGRSGWGKACGARESCRVFMKEIG